MARVFKPTINVVVKKQLSLFDTQAKKAVSSSVICGLNCPFKTYLKVKLSEIISYIFHIKLICYRFSCSFTFTVVEGPPELVEKV